MRGLARLGARPVPPGYPRYGLMIESAGRPVGAVLMIYSAVPGGDGAPVIRCNLSSWYVEPAFRSHAPLLTPFAKDRSVTYVNISAARNTWPTIEAQGFQVFNEGYFLSVPALSGSAGQVGVVPLAASSAVLPERDLLEAHAALGCIALIVEAGGEFHPFVFARTRVVRRLIPTMQLVYCRDAAAYVRFAGPLGRYLLWRGMPSVVVESGLAHEKLVGCFVGRKRRSYARGPNPPRPGDLAYTEQVFFGS